MIKLPKEKPMIIDRYTKALMTVFALALLLNGLNPWINPSQAVAIENTATNKTENSNNCSSQDIKNSIKTLVRGEQPGKITGLCRIFGQ